MRPKALTHKDVEHAKPLEKPYRLWAGGGLYCEVRPTGAKLWRLKYRFDGKEKLLALGDFRDVSLSAAKIKAAEHKGSLADGVDPGQLKAADRAADAAALEAQKAKAASERRESVAARRNLRAKKQAAGATVRAVAEEWHTLHAGGWTDVHSGNVWQSVEDYVLPRIGSKGIADVVPGDVLAILSSMLEDGKIETADRVKQRMGAIFRYGALQGLVAGDPTAVVKDQYAVLKRQRRKASPKQHHPSLSPAELGSFVRRMRAIYATPIVSAAFWLLLLTATRTNEIRGAVWSEFKGLDGEKPEWNIPADRMKARKAHWVPLSRQAAAILRQLKPITQEYGFVFPIVTRVMSEPKPISENAILYYITKSAGYAGTMTGHGCRSLFSTWANESGQWSSQLIEKQLAHVERNEVKAAYDHSQHREGRRKMLQAWADYIDALGGEQDPSNFQLA